MKQYCRYCIHCFVGNGNWCDVREKSYSDATFKRENHCKDFEFCELDVYDPEHTYTPRKEINIPMFPRRKKNKCTEPLLFEEEKE